MSQHGPHGKNDCELTFTLMSCKVAHELFDTKKQNWPKRYKELTEKLTFDMKLFKRHTWSVLKEMVVNEKIKQKY